MIKDWLACNPTMKYMAGIMMICVIALVYLFLKMDSPFLALGRYKFLFRNTTYSDSADVYPTRKGIYELAPVMRGRAYRPNYFFLPERNQYLVRSRLEFPRIPRFDPYAPAVKESVTRHVLLNEQGQVLRSLDTKINFSRYSGLFFADTFYIDWLQTGKSTQIPYSKIFNQDLSMSQEGFVACFRELYQSADYIEYINLRSQSDDVFESGVVFKIQGKWQILLSGLQDSRMRREYTEADEKTAIWEDLYRVAFDYYDPASKEKDPYPQSPASVQMIPLETNTANPYDYKNIVGRRELVMDKYLKENSTGWQGIAKVKGVPIYLPGSSTGIAFMRLHVGKETFRFKIPEVEKMDYFPRYNLGVRLFKVPENLQKKESLVFLESTQNSGEDRPGGGIYVVRERQGENFPVASDLPEGISQERYAQLPLSLQESLLDIEGTTALSIKGGRMREWFPEIELFENLTYLLIRANLTEIPDGIAKLKKLQVLTLNSNNLKKISPEIGQLSQLKILDLFSNELESFPVGLLALKNLTDLSIGANDGITEIPAEITAMDSLRTLDLLLLNISSLPDAMAGMKQLTILRAEKLQQTSPAKFQHLFVPKDSAVDSYGAIK